MKSGQLDSGSRLKGLVAATPMLRAVARSLTRIPVVEELRALRHRFRDSSSYWKQRYRQGGTSGPGPFGRLAEFKAETLNGFVARMGIQSVIEFGCGDGVQLALAAYPRYVGIDVAKGSISACRRRFAGDATKGFYLTRQMPAALGRFDLVVSLDVMYHLAEDEAFDTSMRSLFTHSGRFMWLYSTNNAAPSDRP